MRSIAVYSTLVVETRPESSLVSTRIYSLVSMRKFTDRSSVDSVIDDDVEGWLNLRTRNKAADVPEHVPWLLTVACTSLKPGETEEEVIQFVLDLATSLYQRRVEHSVHDGPRQIVQKLVSKLKPAALPNYLQNSYSYRPEHRKKEF